MHMIWWLILAVTTLIAVSSVMVPVGALGAFERSRQKKHGQDVEIDRDLYHDDIVSLQRVITALLLVITTMVALLAFGWLIGTLIALLVALQYGAIARTQYIRDFMNRRYVQVERKLIGLVRSYPRIFRIIRVFVAQVPEFVLHSKEELRHLIESTTTVLGHDDKQRLLSVMDFDERKVSDIMTPKSVISTVSKSEILGPLVLDDLHKTGHSRIPVIDGDIDHIVGILHLRDALTLDTTRKNTAKVETLMEKRVYYIREHQPLSDAFAAFISTHHHLFIVINEYHETVGLLTLEDVVESMLGTKIVDEYDAHDDMRSVAARQASQRAKTENSIEI